MYGGDDVGAVVLEVGTALTKAGFAGENVPKAVIDSAAGRILDHDGSDSVQQQHKTPSTNADVEMRDADSVPSKGNMLAGHTLERRRDNMELLRPLKDGLAEDWDALECVWRHSLCNVLLADPQEHPMLLVEPTFNSDDRREKMCEIAFEQFETPAVFLAKDSVLAAFSCGRSTALVVNCGAGVSSTVAVHEGYALKTGMVRTKVAGNALDTLLEQLIESNHKRTIEPAYMFKRKIVAEGKLSIERHEYPQTTASYAEYRRREILRDITHSVARVSDSPFDAQSSATIPTMPYELPDGNVLEIGVDRFTLAEQLFRPTLLKVENDFDDYKFEGLSDMVRTTIDRADPDVRRDLYGSIVVSGGTSSIRGMSERLYKELLSTAAPAFKVKTMAVSSHAERLYGPWIGGSILGSLGSFHQMWFSRAEYEEHGAKLIASKCP